MVNTAERKNVNKNKRIFHDIISSGDTFFYLTVYLLLFILLILVLFPLIFVLSASFSSPNAVSTGKVILLPVEFTFEGYKRVLENANIVTGFKNSIFYTVFGTLINIFITLIAAYPLSRKDLPGKSKITLFFGFTMIFSGGMIPNYMLVNSLGIMNTVWAMLLPGALSVYNMIITRTFFESTIPEELYEASALDGCSEFKCFFQVVMPLSKAIVAVIALFYSVSHWNAYFNAYLYLSNQELYPLQIILKNILISSQIDPRMMADGSQLAAREGLADLLKYSLIVISCVPMLIIYPFAQKYFVKGVMIGSIKG